MDRTGSRQQMFKIGDFSRLTQVTVKALRHYDRLGLLKPAHTDPFTGYRFYTSAQLPRLNRILALKDLGFSLEQVGQMLDADLSPGRLRALLKLKQHEVREQIQAEQSRLLRIEARLRQIEQAATPEPNMAAMRTESQRVASSRDIVPSRSVIGDVFRELSAARTRHELAATETTSMGHDPKRHERDIDVDAALVTVDRALAYDYGRVQILEPWGAKRRNAIGETRFPVGLDAGEGDRDPST